MLIGPPIPEMQLLKKLTLKIKGRGHGWGLSSKSQCESNILSTQSALPFLRYSIFKIWPWKSRVKVMDEVTVQSHIPFAPCQSALPFLKYSIFKIWPWKSRVKVMNEITVQCHNVGLASYRLTSLSFHVNWPSHSWNTAFSKFDLENQGSRSWMRSQFNVTMWV